MEALQGFTHFANDNDIYYDNFLVNVDCRQISGDTSGEFGLVLKRNGDDKYYFLINSNTATYSFYLYANGEWETLASGEYLELYPDAFNTISIKVENHVFLIFVNGDFVAKETNDYIEKGEIAITASLHGEGERGVFEFNHLIIRTP